MTLRVSQPQGRGGPSLRTALLVAILMLTALILTWATRHELISDRRDIEQLMASCVRSLGDVVRESSTHGMQAYQGWQDALEQRLLGAAHWIAREDSVAPLTTERLDAIARRHDLNRIHIFDGNGDWLVSNSPSHGDADTCAHCPAVAAGQTVPPGESGEGARWRPRCTELVRPLCEGREEQITIGFREGRWRAGSRFAAAVGRPSGGAVLVNLRADSLHKTLAAVEPAHLIESLGGSHGVRYVVIQAGNGLVAASAGAPELAQLPPLPPAAGGGVPPDGSVQLHEFVAPVGRIFEFLRPIALPGEDAALLRVGLAAAVFGQVRGNLQRQAWLRTLVFLVTLGLAAGLTMAWQRQRILHREIDRIREDLQAHEREALRRERLAAMGGLAASVAHQIRNPLNTIHMLAQQLEREAELPGSTASQVAAVRSESRRIEGIVQQFLDLARPRAPRREQIDVGDVVGAIAQAAEASFRSASVELETVVEPVRAELDRDFVIEIVENLLRNARQASPPGGCVRLDVRAAGTGLEISVADEGPGVPAELRERIFDPYFTTKSSGTGLGLSLVAQMVAGLGGRLQLDEAQARGACFRVWLPRADTGKHNADLPRGRG